MYIYIITSKDSFSWLGTGTSPDWFFHAYDKRDLAEINCRGHLRWESMAGSDCKWSQQTCDEGAGSGKTVVCEEGCWQWKSEGLALCKKHRKHCSQDHPEPMTETLARNYSNSNDDSICQFALNLNMMCSNLLLKDEGWLMSVSLHINAYATAHKLL